ncbi:urease accessory protein UreE [Mesorhizobium sp. RP14(2022)]|uniref:Urease accessory protein UreE n=1 Tax=Mesorhizobium liriopis TaxID=2953882 RepID=A0ABT1C3F4_9HYPH|nr:urease accessory protein UreE [Mesorhizobium liriopis]MCO6049367.1 urease accessory protein UreE [Mesorhizobium liriopis]
MKLSVNTDFTKFPRAGSFRRAADAAGAPAPFDHAVLEHDERHLRRRVLTLKNGERILVDLIAPVALTDGDLLELEDGRTVGIVAPDEEVYVVEARDPVHLTALAWHIGNRHLPAAIEATRIVILRDHVIRDMLQGLGARVTEAVEPFNPLRGAYSGHGHEHGGHHHHDHDHGHQQKHERHAHDHHDHHGHEHHHEHGHRHDHNPPHGAPGHVHGPNCRHG